MAKLRTKMKWAREAGGETQEQLSRRSGVPASVISQLENVRAFPYPTHARRLSEALGIPEDELQDIVESAKVIKALQS